MTSSQHPTIPSEHRTTADTAQRWSRADLDHSPFVVFYEITRACDLACVHCRACAQPQRSPAELTAEQSRALVDQIASFPKRPMFVLTGGDPLKREDVFDLVHYGACAGLEVAMTPSATSLVTTASLARLRDAGLARLAVSLDGADSATHDAFRGMGGSFERTMQIVRTARKLGLPVQVNTTVTKRNVGQLDLMAELLGTVDIVLWSVFFLIPVGRGAVEARIGAEDYEDVFRRLWMHAQRQRYGIKTTEGHHYRRFVLQQGGNAGRPNASASAATGGRAPLGVNDGKGVMFIGHDGVILPSGFLPHACGRFPHDSVIDVYQDHEVFRALRDADRLKGKCGQCEYRHICGGSRARAFALTGDMLAEEPDCVYEPRRQPARQALPAPAPRLHVLPDSLAGSRTA